MITALREWMFRIWYWYVNNVDAKAEILFMNYGYSPPAGPLALAPGDEPNRYSAQLYHLLGSATELRGKDIAEIGSGRGGGLFYTTRTFSPATALGIDLDQQAARFCNRHYQRTGLSFAQGDAQNLPSLANESFDAILNVESSHRYPRMDLFLREVHRLLRPGGHFLYTDFRFDHEIPELRQQLAASGLILIREVMITDQVVEALKADDARKRALVKKLAPWFIHKVALDFAGTTGSETYERFASHKYEYIYCVLQKPALVRPEGATA